MGVQQGVELVSTAENKREGDKVVTRTTPTGTNTGSLFDMYPTGKSFVVTGINIDRIAGGKIVESWGNFDQLGLMQQIGLLATYANRQVG